MNPVISAIAQRYLRLETLETRKRDSLDFSDQAVWCIKEALEAAYQAGLNAQNSQPQLIVFFKDGTRTTYTVLGNKKNVVDIGLDEADLYSLAPRFQSSILIDGAPFNYNASETYELLGLDPSYG